MRKTTTGRILAVQALYQFDSRGPEFREDLGDFLRNASKDPEAIAIGEDLVSNCLERQDELDAHIAAAAEHWDVTRMAAVDRAILRLGTYELLHRPEVPPKVAINEAIRLAKKFSTAESGAFVNGILDKIMAKGSRAGSAPKRK